MLFRSDDIDDIMEQIHRQSADEEIKKNGNAIDKKLNLDKILDDEDEEDERIRREMQRKQEMARQRKLMEEQDEEYETALRQSRIAGPIDSTGSIDHSYYKGIKIPITPSQPAQIQQTKAKQLEPVESMEPV